MHSWLLFKIHPILFFDSQQKVVKEMNRLGMIVDLSHVSENTTRAAIRISRAPVIFSHSSAYSLCNHKRNVPDDIIKSLVSLLVFLQKDIFL